MSDVESGEYRPGPRAGTVKNADGDVIVVPDAWALLPPGDAGLTRRVKALGPSWTVKEKRGRRMFSQGVWAPAENIESAREHVEAQRADPAYTRKLEAGRRRRAEEQARYVKTFELEVRRCLAFDPQFVDMEREMAHRIAVHATPVGSGTVARTARIPVEERARAAVIAWMRHQTTAYDDMHIPRVKGERREVRKKLAARSRALLERYRRGAGGGADCPLQEALSKPVPDEAAPPPPPGPRGRAPLKAETPRDVAQQSTYDKVRARMAAGKTGRRR